MTRTPRCATSIPAMARKRSRTYFRACSSKGEWIASGFRISCSRHRSAQAPRETCASCCRGGPFSICAARRVLGSTTRRRRCTLAARDRRRIRRRHHCRRQRGGTAATRTGLRAKRHDRRETRFDPVAPDERSRRNAGAAISLLIRTEATTRHAIKCANFCAAAAGLEGGEDHHA